MLLMRLLRAFLLRRFLLGGRQRRRGYGGYGGRGYGYGGFGGRGYGGRRRSGGFRFFGPFPTYSTRTRRGSRVTVSGCCLPIPLILAGALAMGVRLLARH
jgi:hypothetical protein